jgi:DNA recombination protein RmuC
MTSLPQPILWSIVAFIGGIVIGLFIGSLIMWLWERSRSGHENERLKIQLAQLQIAKKVEAEKLQWVEQAQEHMRDAFQALASQTLQANSDEFLKRASAEVEAFLNQTRGDWNTQRAELQNLVGPLRENLTALDGHVRELEQKREGAYQGLQEQLRQLAEAQATLQTTTITLAQALKSPTVRGRWGEVQLRRVVEMSGMVKHVSFVEQISTDDGGRPDMIVCFPNGGILPVDSKVPLEAYLEAIEAPDEQARRTKLASHAKAMRSRVHELGLKKYWEQLPSSPEFVVMFVPGEAFLGQLLRMILTYWNMRWSNVS